MNPDILTFDEKSKLTKLIVTIKELLLKSLEEEKNETVMDSGLIIFSDQSADSKIQEFSKLNERAKHIEWAEGWIESLGKTETAS